MRGLGWAVRLRYAMLAGLAGWLAGVAVTVPFEIGVAARYLSGQAGSLLRTLAEGLAIWSAFAFFMALVAWLLLVLPVALLVPPRWIVSWRHVLVPLSPVAAALAMGLRLHIFEQRNLKSSEAFLNVFWIAPNVFGMTFALFLTMVYVLLAARRLENGLPS
jgi:hypothetical protein